MVKLTYNIFDDKIEFVMPVVPKHMAINFAGSPCCCLLPWTGYKSSSKGSIAKFKLQIGRGLVVDIKKEDKKYSIITDYYNSSPESLKARS